MTRAIKDLLRDGALHRWRQRHNDRAVLATWEQAGRPLPSPPAFKKQLIVTMGKRFGVRVLVETGTHWGNTVAGSLGAFDRIYSIELLEELYEHARRRFARHPEVDLRLGDSAYELPRIVAQLKEPALFWLDAHYSGEGTARTESRTPIVEELRAISEDRLKKHVVLIDDARCFDGTKDYPTIEACRTLAARLLPAHRFAVEDDIIRITPE